MPTLAPPTASDPALDLAVAEIYLAGYAAGLVAAKPRLRLVTLADVTAASVTAIRAARS